MIAPGQAVSIG